MEKPSRASDSEDEAFESADEGDLDSGPSQKASEGEVDGVVDTNLDAIAEKVHSMEVEASSQDGMSSKDATEEEEASTQPNSKTTPVQEEDISNDREEIEKAEESQNTDSSTARKESPEDNINAVGKDVSKEIKEQNEPSTERIHESSENVGSDESPMLQAMDRLAEGSSQNPSSRSEDSSSASQSSWGWGGWGSMISKATSSVSSMLETVETQLGIPSPTEMAKLATVHRSGKSNEQSKAEELSMDKEAKSTEDDLKSESAENQAENGNQPSSGLGSWFSGIDMSQLSSVVQNTGKEIMTGGLDALEFVGKKTIDAISHGDPGFRTKRMTLSQAIREAKEKAEQSNTQAASDQANLSTFSVEFDKFQGLAHLEALEMISRESEHELEKLLGMRPEESRQESDALMDSLKSIFQTDENDDNDEGPESKNEDFESFEDDITELVASLSLSVTPAKLISAFSTSVTKSEKREGEAISPEELYSETISCFAEMTARSVELFHKVGELMLLPDVKASFLAKARGSSLGKICSVLRPTISALSTRFATNLNDRKPENDDAVSKMITDIYLEASNSSSHIADSFHLLLPILQLSAIKNA